MEHVFVTLVITSLFDLSLSINYIRDQSLDNMKCVGADVEFETNIHVDKSLECVMLCEKNPGCKSVFHKRTPAAKCYGCRTVYTAPGGLGSETGTKYFKRPYAKYQEGCDSRCLCEPKSNRYCEYILNVCVCTPGYSYNPSSDTCIRTQDCAAYGNTYQKHPRKFINGYDLDMINSATVDTCAAACNADTAFTCLTFDFDFVNDICYLYSETALTVAGAFLFQPLNNYDHYTRNCY